MSRNFEEGEVVLFVDRKSRSNLVSLAVDGEYHTHTGFVNHNAVIGQPEGMLVESTGGAKYLAVRPTLAEFILKMPRGAQVIYPKDIGPILQLADIFPGARVFESGVGSGALSIALLRAGAQVTGYELRSDFAECARKNIETFCGTSLAKNYEIHLRNSYEEISHKDFDRFVLDLPEPWNVVPHARTSLRQGGILVSYVPSIVQVGQLHEALNTHGFQMIETVEILLRSWHIAGRAMRPDHRMVAHTGFLTHARYLDTNATD